VRGGGRGESVPRPILREALATAPAGRGGVALRRRGDNQGPPTAVTVASACPEATAAKGEGVPRGHGGGTRRLEPRVNGVRGASAIDPPRPSQIICRTSFGPFKISVDPSLDEEVHA